MVLQVLALMVRPCLEVERRAKPPVAALTDSNELSVQVWWIHHVIYQNALLRWRVSSILFRANSCALPGSTGTFWRHGSKCRYTGLSFRLPKNAGVSEDRVRERRSCAVPYDPDPNRYSQDDSTDAREGRTRSVKETNQE
jgi:hypothetical protein